MGRVNRRVKEQLSFGIKVVWLADPEARNVTVYRLAHVLNRLGVPLIPRMMTEYAHGKTGIDIHPGATIGQRSPATPSFTTTASWYSATVGQTWYGTP